MFSGGHEVTGVAVYSDPPNACVRGGDYEPGDSQSRCEDARDGGRSQLPDLPCGGLW